MAFCLQVHGVCEQHLQYARIYVARCLNRYPIHPYITVWQSAD
jgi:hypothetical protein